MDIPDWRHGVGSQSSSPPVRRPHSAARAGVESRSSRNRRAAPAGRVTSTGQAESPDATVPTDDRLQPAACAGRRGASGPRRRAGLRDHAVRRLPHRVASSRRGRRKRSVAGTSTSTRAAAGASTSACTGTAAPLRAAVTRPRAPASTPTIRSIRTSTSRPSTYTSAARCCSPTSAGGRRGFSFTAGATRFSAGAATTPTTKFSVSMGGGVRVPFNDYVAATAGVRRLPHLRRLGHGLPVREHGRAGRLAC